MDSNKVNDTAELLEKPKSDYLEVVEPDYIHPEYKHRLHNRRAFRFNDNGKRYYITVDRKTTKIKRFLSEKVTFYPSVTTIIDKASPTPYNIKKMIGDMGTDGFYQFMNERAKYGTLLHMLFGEYLAKERFFDFDMIKLRIQGYAMRNHINVDMYKWEKLIKKDMLSLMQFVIDHDVEPLAIEFVGHYKKGQVKYAGAVDLICNMNIKEKGNWGEVYKSGKMKDLPKATYQENRVLAMIDLKSGKSGFFDSHKIQLNMYRKMFENMTDLKLDRIYNLAPNDWHGDTPTYKYKEQSDLSIDKLIPHMCYIYNRYNPEPKEIDMISGSVESGQDLSTVHQKMNAQKFILKEFRHKFDHDNIFNKN
jgi:hypothetical protein